jgi:ABC-type multidrug transport system ATPase subunit
MSSLGFPLDWVVKPIIVLLAFAVMFYVVGGLGLQFKPATMSIARSRNSDSDFSAGKERIIARSAEEVTAVNIGLDQFALYLDKRTILFKKLPTKTILHPMNAIFQAGMLNVIMGPSGSGKTSLLNAMALRLYNSAGTTYRRCGKMTFNGAIPSDSVIRSVCSYVCQDDDALLPSLTVRETLQFAAGLRLPSHMSKTEKDQRAEEILMKMGLKDCADNLIGSDLIKGISGGEKRRVTIAVQILTDPRVLLLDEPTSGLDAFTASSIMEVLRGLALEGRTLILTIHQSRSDLFKHFGTVLLLARGGSPCYAGPGYGMLPHFESLGHPCPTTINPADFALDLITVDLQHQSREASSRKVVESLINSWEQIAANITTRDATIATPAELGSLRRGTAQFYTAYPILVHRAIINIRRQPDLLVARTMQVIGLGIILALFFAPLKFDYYSIQNRLGFIQEFCALYFVGMLQNVAIYPAEKAVFYREHDDGAYSIEAFFAQYLTVEIPFEVVTCLVFAVLVDFAGGLPWTVEVFFVCFFNCFCIVSCGESLGIMFNTLFSHSGFALNITSVFLSIALCMSGILSISMPGFLKGVNYLSPIRYSIRNLAPYTLRDIILTCSNEQRLPNGNCTIGTGREVLELYQLDGDPLVNILCLGAAAIVYRASAWAILRVVRTRWSGVWDEIKR